MGRGFAAPPPPPSPAGPFQPPTAVCYTLTSTPRALVVGKRSMVTLTVRNRGRLVRNARVLLRGAGINAAARTNARGVARIAVLPKRAGIVQLRVSGQPSCAAKRVGVAKAAGPPLTG